MLKVKIWVFEVKDNSCVLIELVGIVIVYFVFVFGFIVMLEYLVVVVIVMVMLGGIGGVCFYMF